MNDAFAELSFSQIFNLQSIPPRLCVSVVGVDSFDHFCNLVLLKQPNRGYPGGTRLQAGRSVLQRYSPQGEHGHLSSRNCGLYAPGWNLPAGCA